MRVLIGLLFATLGCLGPTEDERAGAPVVRGTEIGSDTFPYAGVFVARGNRSEDEVNREGKNCTGIVIPCGKTDVYVGMTAKHCVNVTRPNQYALAMDPTRNVLDNDSWIDAEDGECSGPFDLEGRAAPACSDWLDNDGDGWIDAEDWDCEDELDEDESL